jgi:hypothetical protein
LAPTALWQVICQPLAPEESALLQRSAENLAKVTANLSFD